MRNVFFLLLVLVLMVSLAACGGSKAEPTTAPAAPADQPAAPTAGDAANGKTLFSQAVLNGNAGCSTCHSVEAGKVLVGPSLSGVATRAGNTVAGESAMDYLHQSIVDPNAHLSKGCNAADLEAICVSSMPLDWAQKLSEKEINDLVAYLMTLK